MHIDLNDIKTVIRLAPAIDETEERCVNCGSRSAACHLTCRNINAVKKALSRTK